MSSYIPQIPGNKLPDGQLIVDHKVKQVIAYHNGQYVRLRLQADGRLKRAGSFRYGSTIAEPGGDYIPREHFIGMLRQAYAILNTGGK